MFKCKCGSKSFEASITQKRLGYISNGEFCYDEGCSLEYETVDSVYCSECYEEFEEFETE